MDCSCREPEQFIRRRFQRPRDTAKSEHTEIEMLTGLNLRDVAETKTGTFGEFRAAESKLRSASAEELAKAGMGASWHAPNLWGPLHEVNCMEHGRWRQKNSFIPQRPPTIWG